MSSLRWALHRFRQLTPRERIVLGQAASLLPAVHALQQALPFRIWRRLLERRGPARSPRIGEPSVREIAWAVDAARNWVPGRYQCLPSAYAAHLLLHRYGYDSDVHVGVRRDAAGKIEAHAWVHCDGRVVVGNVPNLEAFLPLPPLRAVRW